MPCHLGLATINVNSSLQFDIEQGEKKWVGGVILNIANWLDSENPTEKSQNWNASLLK